MSSNIDNKKKLNLSAQQEKDFTCRFKIGILKGLHKKGLLSDEQLKLLIELQKR